MHSAKEFYNAHYEGGGDIPLYGMPLWLDAVCGQDAWEVMSLVENDEMTMMVPIFETKIRGLSAIITPPMTQWIPVVSLHQMSTLHLELFLDSLPKGSITNISLKTPVDHEHQHSDFQVQYRYSFEIPFDPEQKNIRSRYNEGLRRNLKEAEKNYEISVSEDVDTLLTLCHITFKQQKLKSPWWLDDVLPRVYHMLREYKRGEIHIARFQGRAVAAILTGSDKTTTYYLTGGRSAELEGASAHAILLDHVIRKAIDEEKQFDFEGSMHPGIANFFQSFGAIPKPYVNIQRYHGMGRLWSYFKY